MNEVYLYRRKIHGHCALTAGPSRTKNLNFKFLPALHLRQLMFAVKLIFLILHL